MERASASSGRRRLPPRATTWTGLMTLLHRAHAFILSLGKTLQTPTLRSGGRFEVPRLSPAKGGPPCQMMPSCRHGGCDSKLALEDLREMKGFGTELVTLIILPDRQISDARSMLQNEHGQAANIKSKGTRKNVQGAIESAISTLSRFKTPGENGLAIFVGSIIVGNNKSRMVNIVVEELSNACIVPLPM